MDEQNGLGMAPLEEKIIVRRILKDVPTAKVEQDLERLRSMAINLGAFSAVVISADEIIIDERVRAKCLYPKCDQYGQSINCPPYAPELDLVRKIVKGYRYAVLFSVKDETGTFVGTEFHRSVIGKKNPTKITFNTICAEIESRAFYEGYYFALAFGQGPCKTFWCPDRPCAAIQPGEGCRFPVKARSSMEAVGMDVFSMAANQGWEIYPCGARIEKEDIPHVLLVGLVLIC